MTEPQALKPWLEPEGMMDVESEPKLRPCRHCGKTPRIGYARGEYLVITETGCFECMGFNEMHSSEEQEIAEWNERMGVKTDD